jgi:23S rRNA (cytidine1920-2'-O)/16S rRNA (cytidine1409-2'-O)-methyltransferase
VVLKPSATIKGEAQIEVERGPRFVSRGGEKLEAALQEFDVSVKGMACADVGASTGGFTDCLLQSGAKRVYAIDVGSGILHWKLRQDARVVVMEGTNARHLQNLPEPVDLITTDVSFISVKVLLPVFPNWLSERSGTVILLIKPQFEAGRKDVGRGSGVIRDASVHREVLIGVLDFAEAKGYGLQGLIRSPLLGPKGNVEFLAWLEFPGESQGQVMTAVEGALEDVQELEPHDEGDLNEDRV